MFRHKIGPLPRLASLFCGLCGAALITTDLYAGPISVWHPAEPETSATRATFWGQPYPYGYAYLYRDEAHRDDECLERRKVRTAQGWRWKTVQVCHDHVVRK